MNHKFALFYVALISITLTVSLYVNSSVVSSSETFVLKWPPEQQEIVDGTFRIELTFNWGNQSLYITVKVNDDDFDIFDYLALVFDVDGNGTIDFLHKYQPYMFFVSNRTCDSNSIVILFPRDNRTWHPGQDEELGWVGDTTKGWLIRSPYHNCTFTEGVGYLFNILIPKSELVNVNGDVVYVFFFDRDAGTQWGGDWVSRRVWGWR